MVNPPPGSLALMRCWSRPTYSRKLMGSRSMAKSVLSDAASIHLGVMSGCSRSSSYAHLRDRVHQSAIGACPMSYGDTTLMSSWCGSDGNSYRAHPSSWSSGNAQLTVSSTSA